MKLTTAAFAFVGASQALVVRDQSCCFHLSAKGGPGGDVGQLSDGQNRIGQSGLPEGDYCIDGSGSITDGNGRGCILTPPTTQFQCDVGATPTPGFSVGCTGDLQYQGNVTFWACPTGDNGGYNIYTEPVANQPGCTMVSLDADNCKSNCPVSSGCPADLPSNYEFPHLIVPVDSASPDTSHGTSYDGSSSATISSIFNFDIPASDKGKQCSLKFLLPAQSQLQTSSFTLTGSGGIDFALLSSPATSATTYNNAPSIKQDYGTFQVSPGNSYSIATFDCPAGGAIGVKMSSCGDQCLEFFQDYNPCPIGLYIFVS